MTRGHCHDWFRKWKRDGNFCGLRPQDEKEIDRYMGLVEKIAPAVGKDEDFIHDHFTAGAARPLLRCKDEKAYEKALNYVVSCLKREEMITGGDLQATIDGFLGKSKSTQMRTSGKEEKPEQKTEGEKTDAPPQPSLAEQIKPKPSGSSPFHTAAQELAAKKGGIAGEMYPDKCPTAPEPTGDAIPPLPPGASMKEVLARDELVLKRAGNLPRSVRSPPNTLTITFDDSQWNTLRQLVRASQAESLEEAVKFCVDEVGRQAGGA